MAKKIRCTHKDCKEAAQRIIGDCGFCNGTFCGKHRLLEDHKCTGLEDVSSCSGDGEEENKGEEKELPKWCLLVLQLTKSSGLTCYLIQCKKESHDRNAAQLNAERTTVIKGI
jgi:hypothetical protein